MKFPSWTDKSYDKTVLLAGYIGQMRTEQCSSNSLCCFAMWLPAALLSLGRRLRAAVCPCVVSPMFSIHMVPLMAAFVSLQPAHAVHPAARPVCSHQHPAAGAAAGHGHAHHIALAPCHRHTETTAPHHGSGKLLRASCCFLTSLLCTACRLWLNFWRRDSTKFMFYRVSARWFHAEYRL